MLIFTLAALFLASHSYATADIYTAAVKNGKVIKSNDFSCTDSIYVFVESEGAQEILADARVEWIDPSGALVRTVTAEFQVLNSSQRYLWDGIEFTPGGGRFANLASLLFDPSEGLEDVVGKWSVTVYLAHNKTQTENFTVLC